jgi:hypothetical protein
LLLIVLHWCLDLNFDAKIAFLFFLLKDGWWNWIE